MCEVGQHPGFKGTDEGVARASLAGSVSPLMSSALLALDAQGSSNSTAAAPSWLVPPPKKPYDPTYHPPVDDDAYDSPLYRALTADSPFGVEHYERDGNLHREAAAVVETSEDFRYTPWALAVAMSADAWKPRGGIPISRAARRGCTSSRLL